MNSKGFMLPVVLAFILITSGFILYQAFNLINQIYSVESQVEDVKKLEVMVNTRRSIASYEDSATCGDVALLSYSGYQIRVNCLYTATENDQYNKIVEKLIEGVKLSQADYESLKALSKGYSSEKSGDKKVVITSGSDDVETRFEKKYNIFFLEYNLEEEVKRVLITDENGQLISNINVK